jgi:hypothetical protein
MRSYSVAVTSLAIDAPPKWTDNILSQYDIPGILLERRGVARRIPHTALLELALIRELNITLNLGIREAVGIAAALWAHEGEQQFGVLHLSFDRAELGRTVERRLREALESAPAPRRGRPVRRQLPIED